MHEFFVFGFSFNACLFNLNLVLQRYEKTNLILNWEKCHFYCAWSQNFSDLVLRWIEQKMEIIEKLPSLTNIKGVRSFLGNAGFYRRFIRDFFEISKPLSNLLMKDIPFDFSHDYL